MTNATLNGLSRGNSADALCCVVIMERRYSANCPLDDESHLAAEPANDIKVALARLVIVGLMDFVERVSVAG
jgi:hypothetical protein